MGFKEKLLYSFILLGLFLIFAVINLLYNNKNLQVVEKVISSTEFLLNNGEIYKYNSIQTFDSDYTEKNINLAKVLNINEDEAFIVGNLGKYWTKNQLEGRKIKIGNQGLVYNKFGYETKLENSAFGIRNGQPTNKYAFDKQINSIRKGKYVILDLENDIAYPISKINREKIKNYVVVRQNHVKNIMPKTKTVTNTNFLYNPVYKSNNWKIIVSDLTTKIKPDRDCSSEICKVIEENINKSTSTIDMAIYGYSSTPKIEQAIKNAKSRGVKIRLVYDIDSKGNNIYPDTYKFTKLIPENKNDKDSPEVRNTMHNKFYIFDKKIVITGSANLSHTDMSGYNSNSILVIDSPKIAEFYTQEFNQMFNGKFHNQKISYADKKDGNFRIFFSPEDKTISNGVLPLIKQAKKYIYVPVFVITEKRITSELINAKSRGVDVRVIADALNASTQHSKHKELRNAGIPVKAENYAGKMHSKTMIIDDEYLIIGSMNFSNSGENKNDENLIILKDSASARFYKQFFLYQWNRIHEKWLKYTPRAEGPDSIGSCSDGIDNNYDGYTDLEDTGCKR